MLTALRRAAGSWIAKILFALLIVSFAVWGIGDIFRGGGGDVAVATVGGTRITLEEALAEYRREMSQLNRQFGGQFEPTEPIRRAIASQVATRLAAGRAIDAEAVRMGLAVGDETLRQAVFSLPVFAGPDGRFARPFFDNFLRNQGMSENQFLAILRADLARQTLIGAARGGASAPEGLARMARAYEGEVREALVAAIELASLPPPEMPDEAALRRWYDLNPEAVSAPEYRRIQVAIFGPDQLAPGITVPDEDVAAAFAARRAEFEQPERRDADQLQFADEAAAGVLAAQWRLGAPWELMAARAAEAGGTATRLGLVAREAIPIPALAAGIFAGTEPGVPDPIRTPFGWAVVRINRIEPARTATLEEVAPRLREIIARERAADLVYTRERRIEDALAGGMSLPDAAREHGMRLIEIEAVDAQGRDPQGLAVDLGPVGAAALAAAFAATPSSEPRMQEAAGGVFFAAKVLGVTPSAPRPFEAVRETVLAAVQAEALARAAEEKATALMTAARAPGATLASAAEAAGIAVGRTGPIPRPDPRAPSPVPAELARAVFALPIEGEISMVRTGTGFAVISLAAITAAPDDAAALAAARTRASQALGEDVEQVFVDQLRTRANATLNPRGIELLAQP
jgi:peptidyl-prolyl cis-trans isomerase D